MNFIERMSQLANNLDSARIVAVSVQTDLNNVGLGKPASRLEFVLEKLENAMTEIKKISNEKSKEDFKLCEQSSLNVVNAALAGATKPGQPLVQLERKTQE